MKKTTLDLKTGKSVTLEFKDPIGLPNPNNYCFLNAALQLMLAIPTIEDLIRTETLEASTPDIDAFKAFTTKKKLCWIIKILLDKDSVPDKDYSTSLLRDLATTHSTTFIFTEAGSIEQEDSDAAFIILLEILGSAPLFQIQERRVPQVGDMSFIPPIDSTTPSHNIRWVPSQEFRTLFSMQHSMSTKYVHPTVYNHINREFQAADLEEKRAEIERLDPSDASAIQTIRARPLSARLKAEKSVRQAQALTEAGICDIKEDTYLIANDISPDMVPITVVHSTEDARAEVEIPEEFPFTFKTHNGSTITDTYVLASYNKKLGANSAGHYIGYRREGDHWFQLDDARSNFLPMSSIKTQSPSGRAVTLLYIKKSLLRPQTVREPVKIHFSEFLSEDQDEHARLSTMLSNSNLNDCSVLRLDNIDMNNQLNLQSLARYLSSAPDIKHIELMQEDFDFRQASDIETFLKSQLQNHSSCLKITLIYSSGSHSFDINKNQYSFFPTNNTDEYDYKSAQYDWFNLLVAALMIAIIIALIASTIALCVQIPIVRWTSLAFFGSSFLFFVARDHGFFEDSDNDDDNRNDYSDNDEPAEQPDEAPAHKDTPNKSPLIFSDSKPAAQNPKTTSAPASP